MDNACPASTLQNGADCQTKITAQKLPETHIQTERKLANQRAESLSSFTKSWVSKNDQIYASRSGASPDVATHETCRFG